MQAHVYFAGIIWDCTDWSAKKVLTGHSGSVYSCAFSAEVLVTGSRDKTARIWDARDGTWNCLRVLEGHTNFVEGVAFSPNFKVLVSVSADRTLRVWDANPEGDWHCLRTLRTGHRDRVRCVAFSPAGDAVLTGSDDRYPFPPSTPNVSILRSESSHA